MTFIVHITKRGDVSLYVYGPMIEIAEAKGAHAPLCTDMQKGSVVLGLICCLCQYNDLVR